MSHTLNIVRLQSVAQLLGDINDNAVYIGGATVSLYARPEEAEGTRPTDDIDVIVQLATYSGYANLTEQLLERGFQPDSTSAIICRFRVQGLLVDVMPIDENVLGFVNCWYKPGFETAVTYQLPNQYTIRILTPAYFFATKLEAYFDRGEQDFWGSKDLEDIIYLIDVCDDLLDSIRASDLSVREFIGKSAEALLNTELMEDYVLGQLTGKHQEARRTCIMEWLRGVMEENYH